MKKRKKPLVKDTKKVILFKKMWNILDKKKNLYAELAALTIEQRELLEEFDRCNEKLIQT